MNTKVCAILFMYHSIFRHSDHKRSAFIRTVTLPIQPLPGYLVNLKVVGLAKLVQFKIVQVGCGEINEGDKTPDENAHDLTIEIQQNDVTNPFSTELFNTLCADTNWKREILKEISD